MLNGALEENPKFTGQTHDIDTDLYYYNARYYDPTLGRFLQADSLIANVFQPQTINPYAYVLNNPLKYTDPTGHAPVSREYAEEHGTTPEAYFNGDNGVNDISGDDDSNDPIGHPNLDPSMNGNRRGGGDDNGVQQSSLTVGNRDDPANDDAVFIINIGTGETKDGPGLSSVSFSDYESTVSSGQSGTATIAAAPASGGRGAAVGSVAGNIVARNGASEFLNNLSTYSAIAGIGAELIPGGQVVGLILLGISAGSGALNIALYSKDPIVDTARESMKMLLGSQVSGLAGMFTDKIIDEATRK